MNWQLANEATALSVIEEAYLCYEMGGLSLTHASTHVQLNCLRLSAETDKPLIFFAIKSDFPIFIRL
jgi:hypothetical protein